MKNLLKLTAAFALLLASWMAPNSVSAAPYYCHCNWCYHPLNAQTACQNPYNETRTTCGNFYSNYCI
jgi:hypothetical protein